MFSLTKANKSTMSRNSPQKKLHSYTVGFLFSILCISLTTQKATARVLNCVFKVPKQNISLYMTIAAKDQGEQLALAFVEPDDGNFKKFLPNKSLIPLTARLGFIEYKYEGQTAPKSQEIVVSDLGDKEGNSFKAWFLDSQGTPITIWVHTWREGSPAYLHNFHSLPPEFLTGSCS